jgi:hypothetical protein
VEKPDSKNFYQSQINFMQDISADRPDPFPGGLLFAPFTGFRIVPKGLFPSPLFGVGNLHVYHLLALFFTKKNI